MHETCNLHLIARRRSQEHWNTTPEKDKALDTITDIVGNWDNATKQQEPVTQHEDHPEDKPPPNEELLQLLDGCNALDVEFRQQLKNTLALTASLTEIQARRNREGWKPPPPLNQDQQHVNQEETWATRAKRSGQKQNEDHRPKRRATPHSPDRQHSQIVGPLSP